MELSQLALGELLRDLSIAWKNLASYPPGHPRLTQSLDAARRQLERAIPVGENLALGVLRDGLLRGTEKIEMISAQRLGEALHRRHVAVLMLSGETTARELESFLRLLAADPRRVTRPLWDELQDAGVYHIALRPVDFEGVHLSDSDEPPPEHGGPQSLGEALIRELMRGRDALPFGADGAGPDELVALIGALFAESERADQASAAGSGGAGAPGGGGADAAGGEEGGSPRAVRMARGLSRAVDEFLNRARGEARAQAIHELSLMMPKLAPKLRLALAEAAVRSLGAASARGEDGERERADGVGLENLLRKLAPAEVVEALRRASAGGVQLSARTLRLAQMLAQAGKESGTGDAAASARALAELEQLFRDDDIDVNVAAAPDPDRLAPVELPQPREVPAAELPSLGPRLDTLAANAVTAQLLSTLLDLVVSQPARQIQPGVLARLEELYRELLGVGRFVAAMQVIATLTTVRGGDSAETPSDELRRVVERLGNRESIRSILTALRDLPETAYSDAARLVERLGAPAMRHLLALLSEEQDRSLRHRLMGVLSALGPAVVPEASFLLQDARWFVVRNMIVLLRTVGDQGSLPALRRLAEHADLRVRLEAIKSLLAFDAALPASLLARAVQDPDPTLAESAIGLIGAYNIAQGVKPLLELLSKPDRLGRRRSVRLRALRTLGLLAQASALPELERLFLRERWFGKPPSEERQAAFRALASFTVAERQPFVERGMKSRDAAVRAICKALAEGKIRAPDRETEEGVE